MKYRAEIIVNIRDGIRDPQGIAVSTVLKRMNIDDNATINVGKYFSLIISANNQDEANQKLDYICQEILSNPILEDYQIQRIEQI